MAGSIEGVGGVEGVSGSMMGLMLGAMMDMTLQELSSPAQGGQQDGPQGGSPLQQLLNGLAGVLQGAAKALDPQGANGAGPSPGGPDAAGGSGDQQLQGIMQMLQALMQLMGGLLNAAQGGKNPFDSSDEAKQAGERMGGGGAPGGAQGAGGADGVTPAGSRGGASNQAMVNEINRVRQEHGLGPVTEDPALSAAAQQNDRANNAKGELGHHVGLLNGSRGEITAYASNGESAKQAVDQWLNSPGHRAILLDPNMTKVGISISGDYATADFS